MIDLIRRGMHTDQEHDSWQAALQWLILGFNFDSAMIPQHLTLECFYEICTTVLWWPRALLLVC